MEVGTEPTEESMGAGTSVAEKPFVDPMDDDQEEFLGDGKGEEMNCEEAPIEQSQCGDVEDSVENAIAPNPSDAVTKTNIVEESITETSCGNVENNVEECAEVVEKAPVKLTEDRDDNCEIIGLPKEVIQSGLSLLAQYQSGSEDSNDDSDASSVVEVKDAKDYRNQVVEVESDVESNSTSSSDDSDSDTEFKSRIRKLIDKPDEDDDSDEDESNTKPRKRQPPRVRGELLLEDLPPIEDLHITVPSTECIELGKVHSIVDQLVLVNALPNSILVDLDTVLFLENGQKVLGTVFDVLGQVADPLYCVRFNSHDQIEEKGIHVGDKVFVAPKTEYTQYVILSNLIQQRGSDASWENDIEPPPRFLDYSDDEEERKARAQARQKDRPRESDDVQKRARTATQNEESPTMPTTPAAGAHRRESTFRQRQRNFRAPSQRGSPASSYHPNFNPNSWHTNYYPPVRGLYPVPPNFGGPFPQHYPNFAPPPMYGPPVGLPPQSPLNCVLNPYAIRPPTLQLPFTQSPPPPPGT